ncbi:MAG: ROK family transcriptional regulator [Christensenellaceae bacterium]
MSIRGNSTLLKNINRSLIINTIKAKEPISRAEIVNITRLALPTVLRNVNKLIEEGIILETGKKETDAGRRPIMLEINKSAGFYVGVSFGRKVNVILTDFAGNVLDDCRKNSYMTEGPTGHIKQIKKIIFDLMENNNIELSQIMGMGVATLDTGFKTGSTISSSEFYGWEKIDNAKLISKIIPEIKSKFEYLPICGAVAEQWFGGSVELENILYLYVDYGVGGGLIMDGKVYKGKDGHSAHLGHHVVNFDGRQCYCGNKGCLETYTSTTAIVNEIKEKVNSGEIKGYLSRYKNDVSKIDFNMIEDRYQNNDQDVIDIIMNASKILGVGIGNAINLYNPDVVILGGEISNTFPKLVNEAKRVAKEHVFMMSSKNTPIRISSNGINSEALGAIALIMGEIYKINTFRE